MAGMLPGVECARRRRFHQSAGASDSPTTAAIGLTRRSSFCLYTSNHETHHRTSGSFLNQRNMLNQAYEDEKLGGAAKQAKERLNERLRSKTKSEPRRRNSKESSKMGDERCMGQGGLLIEVYGSKKSGSKKFSWTKLSWKASDQDECAICLDGFRAGETLVHLPCAHRFHSRCLVPWLQNNAHCPCCRVGILS